MFNQKERDHAFDSAIKKARRNSHVIQGVAAGTSALWAALTGLDVRDAITNNIKAMTWRQWDAKVSPALDIGVDATLLIITLGALYLHRKNLENTENDLYMQKDATSLF